MNQNRFFLNGKTTQVAAASTGKERKRTVRNMTETDPSNHGSQGTVTRRQLYEVGKVKLVLDRSTP